MLYFVAFQLDEWMDFPLFHQITSWSESYGLIFVVRTNIRWFDYSEKESGAMCRRVVHLSNSSPIQFGAKVYRMQDRPYFLPIFVRLYFSEWFCGFFHFNLKCLSYKKRVRKVVFVCVWWFRSWLFTLNSNKPVGYVHNFFSTSNEWARKGIVARMRIKRK